MLTWDKNDERYFHHGLDRGVLYPSEVPARPLVARNIMPDPNVVNPSSYPSVYGNEIISLASGEATITPSKTTTNDTFMSPGGDLGAIRLGFVPGKKYTISATVNTPVAQTGTVSPNARRIITFAKAPSTGAGYVNVSSPQGPAVGSGRVSVTFTIPADATDVFFRAYNSASKDNGIVKWSKFQIEEGAVATPFFSGATPEDLYGYSWEGAANASPSLKKEIIGTAIPWNGITGMDEAGNGSSSIYYIDGKVFLADVDATDFSGKLSAYSWPDAFSKALGFPEATDGLYVDNQKPKQFNFSYRSLIGSGLSGDQFGYQIHLVYKAMATFSGRARKTVNNSPGPMEFGFDLVCTPVALPGYRPSAHYIIDTRHLSKTTITMLEGILYGDNTHAPRMPTPTELFDMLNFGSAITFVKFTHPILGECWTASGAYANVHYTGDGSTFEILNVNGTDLGNGQYQLSDTP